MESLRELFIKLGLSVDAASFAEALALEKLVEKGAEMLKEAFLAIPEFAIHAIEQTAEFSESMELLSTKTGVGVEAIQRLGYVASLSGSSAEALGVGLRHLARQSEAAKGGSEEAQKAFSDLGVSMNDVRTMSPDKILLKMSDKMKELGPGTETAGRAMKVLGRSGTELVPTLIKGSEEIQRMGDHAEAMGDIMGEDAIKAGAEFKEGLEDIEAATKGLTHEIGSLLIEAVRPMIHAVIEWWKENRKLISQNLKAIIEGVVSAAKSLLSVIMWLGRGIATLLSYWKLFAFILGSVAIPMLYSMAGALGTLLVNFALNTIAAALYGATMVAAAVASASAWLVATAPLILVAAAILLAALAAEDFYMFMTGGESVLGKMGPAWTNFLDSWTKPAKDDWWLTTFLKDALRIITDITGHLDTLAKFIPGLGLGLSIGKAVNAVQEQSAVNAQADKTHETIARNDFMATGNNYVQAPEMRARIFGQGNSPEETAASYSGQSNYVTAPKFDATFNIHAGEGANALEIAGHTKKAMEEFYDSKLREAAATAGH